MNTKRATGLVKQRQDPLRARYREAAAEAWITDGARTISACGGDPFHGVVVPANSDGPLQFGVHRAVGGFHDYPNPGDLLSAALAACFDSTLRIIAERLGIRLELLEVKVDSECDVRGCLQVDRTVPVGFQRMRCSVKLETQDPIGEEARNRLIATAEQCCVVMQTLRHGVTVEVSL